MAFWMESLLQDVRLALRTLRRAPGPFLIMIATLALGIGATTAVFSMVDRVLFRPLPYAAQDRLVWFGLRAPINKSEFLLEGSYYFFREHQRVFDSMAAMWPASECDLNQDNPERLICSEVNADFLPTLGIQPLLGRNFNSRETTPHGPRAVLLTHAFWIRHFGGNAGVLGRNLMVDSQPAEIIGVLPRQFEMPTLARVDVLLPLQVNIAPHGAGSFLFTIGRLKSGIGIEQARTALYPIYLECMQDVPAGFAKDVSFHISSLREHQVHEYRGVSLVLFGAVLFLLLIACANVANVLLARAAGHLHELAVRAAIGASRARLMRQALTESLVISVLGGLAGLLVATGLLRALVALAPDSIPQLSDAVINVRVLLFTFIATAVCGVLFGIAPAVHIPQAEWLNTARSAAAAPGGRTFGARQLLTATQIGSSFVLLSGAGLLIESLWNLQREPLGLHPEHVLTATVQLGRAKYPDGPHQDRFYEDALQRLSELPGLRAVALTDSLPPTGNPITMIFSNIAIEGHAPPDPHRATGGMTVFRTVTPGYFAALGVRMLRGRPFNDDDRDVHQQAAIIDEALARRLFGSEDPIGRRMRSGAQEGPWWTIVGVAEPVKNAGLRGGDLPEYYYAWRRGSGGATDIPFRARSGTFLMRSIGDPRALASLVRGQIAQVDPTLPLTISTMEQDLSKQVQQPRFQSFLLSLFAAIGVLLAAVGQLGVVSYLVTQRSRELGIRLALGATARNIITLMLRNVLAPTLAGAAIGLSLAWGASHFLESLLFEVRAHDLRNFAWVFAFLICVSLAAAWAPVRRALQLDPVRVLRQD